MWTITNTEVRDSGWERVRRREKERGGMVGGGWKRRGIRGRDQKIEGPEGGEIGGIRHGLRRRK